MDAKGCYSFACEEALGSPSCASMPSTLVFSLCHLALVSAAHQGCETFDQLVENWSA